MKYVHQSFDTEGQLTRAIKALDARNPAQLPAFRVNDPTAESEKSNEPIFTGAT